MELLEKLTNPMYNRERANAKKTAKSKLVAEQEEETRILLIEMDEANFLDQQAIADKSSAALHRLTLIPKVDDMLRKKPIQTLFLASGGCKVLEQWLEPNTDGSFPAY